MIRQNVNFSLMKRKTTLCGIELGSWYLPVVVVLSIILGTLNSFLGHANSFIFHLPLFLDTIGTLISTALFGLAAGLLTAGVTHITPDLFSFMAGGYLPWVFCSAASAVSLWIFIRSHRFSNLLHVSLVTITVTLANAFTGAIVAVFFFSGMTNHPVDFLMTGFVSIGQSLFSAAFWARIPANFIDKGIAVLITFGIYRWCCRREGIRLNKET